ncbi:MAG TPA: hypothetical protein VFW00_03575 [Rhodocyclaceae bacterium]|nr:hypothetical protein [Rhodocyclaceae bacterium]
MTSEYSRTSSVAVSGSRRVAIIAVHGVADQRLGDTAQTLAELLVAQTPNNADYAPGIIDDVILQVPPIEPLASRTQASITGAIRKARKYFRQSLGSDFVRHDHATTNDKRALRGNGPLTPGADFTDYLLNRAKQNHMPADTYTVPRVSLNRSAAGVSRKVDIYEMYWADLSRLSGKVPRILTELFTLLFRLSTLGRDTVQAAAAEYHDKPSWTWLSRLQTALDWAYSRLLALLFLQLVMLASVFVPLGLVSDQTALVHRILAVVLGAGALLGIAYLWRRFIVAAASGLALGVILWKCAGAAPEIIGVVWLIVLSIIYDNWLKICAERFRLVRTVGWMLWGPLLLVLAAQAWMHMSSDMTMWVTAALRGVEYVLVAMAIWWIVAGVLLPGWMVAGILAGRHGFHARASVATGRLALVVSLGFFLALAMSAWALASKGLTQAIKSFAYDPEIFKVACSVGQKCISHADEFLNDRFAASTSMFSLIAVLLLCLVAYLLITFVPSVLSELKATKDKSERLGRWLTNGYRWLDFGIAIVVFTGVLCSLIVGLQFLSSGMHMHWPVLPDMLRGVVDRWRMLSSNLLDLMVYTAASATLAFSGIGGWLSRHVPALRAPLDAALDVDNHFREFPSRAIPRARIFSRYVALLTHVSRQGYDRIVVVSHSQGTVISAELFRYMKERAAINPNDAVGMIWKNIRNKLRLFTAGSPLRQLYAARFPVMYDWVLRENQADVMGPLPGDVGVDVWVNAYATGDYVGRWIWSRGANPKADNICSQIDSGPHGQQKYEPEFGLPVKPFTSPIALDVCLGAGAHTHYFDKDNGKVAPKVAALVDALVMS